MRHIRHSSSRLHTWSVGRAAERALRWSASRVGILARQEMSSINRAVAVPRSLMLRGRWREEPPPDARRASSRHQAVGLVFGPCAPGRRHRNRKSAARPGGASGSEFGSHALKTGTPEALTPVSEIARRRARRRQYRPTRRSQNQARGDRAYAEATNWFQEEVRPGYRSQFSNDEGIGCLRRDNL